MSVDSDLYRAILARRSVRRYDRAPLDEDTLAQVRQIVSNARPLIPDNRFQALLRDVSADEDLVASLGGYGRIITPPHYLVPYMTGERYLLEDLGYRTEQIAVRLTTLEVGSCYIGSLGREAAVRSRFALPEGARIGAFLVFGRPSATWGGRSVNALMRAAVGATNKLPAERLFFQDGFDKPAVPPPEIAPLIEAARHAPSAVHAQPWRFLWQGERLHLFVKRHNPRYGDVARAEYRLFDGGTCMGNVTLALEALWREGQWVTYGETEAEVPAHPASLQPMATLLLK